jgi:Domain of unknown function (DUF4062)
VGTKKYQVFVSSTFQDLKHERERVLRALIENSYLAAGMEYFPAIDEEQFNFIKTVIDDSDYYVAIVAGKYGSLAPDGLGYCEKEYEYAREKSLPIIALLRADTESLVPHERELTPERISMLKQFTEKLSNGRLVQYWKDETDLCNRLISSLSITSKNHPRVGWVRENHNSDLDIVEFIRNKMARIRIGLCYKHLDSQGTLVDGSHSFTGIEIAKFVIPRMGYVSPVECNQVGTETISTSLQSLINNTTSKQAKSISSQTTREVISMFDSYGLIIRTTNGFGKMEMLMTTTLAQRLLIAQINEHVARRTVKPTFLKIMEDINRFLITRPPKGF